MAFPSDLSRTKNWGTEILTDSDLEGQFDLIINWVMAALNSTTGHTHDGTSNQGPKIPVTNLTVGSQAQGDIIYASSATGWARLGAGTNGQFLKTQGAGANPVWADNTVLAAATQAEMEAASSNTVSATPGRLQYHPGVAKAWGSFDGTGTPTFSVRHNLDASITDNGTGDYTLSFTTDFSSGNYVMVATAKKTSAGNDDKVFIPHDATPGAGSIRIIVGHGSFTATDSSIVNVAFFGDQA